MKLFLDSADINEISEISGLGLLDGVTTNPTLISKSKKKFKELIKEICEIIPGPVAAETLSNDYDSMLRESLELAELGENIVIKVPMTIPGIKLISELNHRNIQTNVTLCFSASQAIIAAKAGASFVSVFIGRIDDIGYDGVELLREIRVIFDNYDIKTELLTDSIQNLYQVKQAAIAGSDAITISHNLFMQLFKNPLTDIGLQKYLEDSKIIVF